MHGYLYSQVLASFYHLQTNEFGLCGSFVVFGKMSPGFFDESEFSKLDKQVATMCSQLIYTP